jgi:hypothetical protein
MNEAITAVIARLDRATQYSREASDGAAKPRRTGSPGQAGRDNLVMVSTLPNPKVFLDE